MSSELNYNRLKEQSSLYLRQHQSNPIHWWPYGPEAIDYAKKNNLPIFLSVGYSSCHWCHVMSHESFSDQAVANFLNEYFVSIKVDREEYPDIDNYYQKAAQSFGNSGGWPLSAFLLPDMRPFYVGNYYPLHSQKNMPSFPDLLRELKRAYDEERDQVYKNAEDVTQRILENKIPEGELSFEGHFPAPEAILNAIKGLRDEENGGFGKAPKFPMFRFYEWALEQILEGMMSKENVDFIVKSLNRMLMGGILDHARGGGHRYSTDEKWLVPHFEKMLYDQAGLLRVLTKFGLINPSPLVFDAIINTLDYLENEMLAEEVDGKCHFFSAQDADSEGMEGLYFSFTESEFEDALNKNDDNEETFAQNLDKIKSWSQITSEGNFEGGLNVISLNHNKQDEIFQKENWDIIRKVRRAILSERKERMPPLTDNKGIASWNFMLVSALAEVVQYTQIDIIKKMASELLNKTLGGIFKTFIDQETGKFTMRHSTTMAQSLPYLEDFVTFAESQLRLYEISANSIFKENFKDVLNFIIKEFLSDSRMLTRGKSSEHFEIYPNEFYTSFDSSFHSPVATFLYLCRRASILFYDRNYLDVTQDLKESMTQTILKINPLGAGEALRALTYPDQVFRVMNLPSNWIQKPQFLKFLPYLLPRFVLNYSSERNQDEDFEICNMNACELKGLGLPEFIQILTPAHTNGE